MRSLYFAATIERLGGTMQLSAVTGELQMPPDYKHRVLPMDRLILKQNWKQIAYVDRDAGGEADGELGGAGTSAGSGARGSARRRTARLPARRF